MEFNFESKNLRKSFDTFCKRCLQVLRQIEGKRYEQIHMHSQVYNVVKGYVCNTHISFYKSFQKKKKKVKRTQ